MKQKKCIIFGTGYMGTTIFSKIKATWGCEIVAYSDNNQAAWGKELNGVPVVPPSDLRQFVKDKDILIIICIQKYYTDVASQLELLNCLNYHIAMDSGFLYNYNKGVLYPEPCSYSVDYYKKSDENKFSVLFVQMTPCSRTEKIASVLKSKGIETYCAYTLGPSRSVELSFIKEYGFWSIDTLFDFVNTSDFDIVHCSNEPDCLTNFLLTTNKTIIHDTHDMVSIRMERDVDENARTLEHIANTQAKGIMCTSEGVRDITVGKYKVSEEKIFVLENLPIEAYKIDNWANKLSSLDGKIHCVYEGSISYTQGHHRFFEDIWMKIISAGIHIHYYSHMHPDYCKQLADKNEFLHYEGNLHASKLANEMTKYDVGLLYFNLNCQNRIHQETSSANKMYEYLNSGLPVAVDDATNRIKFVHDYECGDYLDLNGDILEQLKIISSIPISKFFLQENDLTMDSKANEILGFYKKIACL